MYDRENSKIGFWKANCSELWERLQLFASPPPESSEGPNSNETFAPSVAPSALQHDLHPGIKNG